jgi:hypothetical protein
MLGNLQFNLKKRSNMYNDLIFLMKFALSYNILQCTLFTCNINLSLFISNKLFQNFIDIWCLKLDKWNNKITDDIFSGVVALGWDRGF